MQSASSFGLDDSLANNIDTVSTDFLGCKSSLQANSSITSDWLKPVGLFVATMIAPVLSYGADTEIPDSWNTVAPYCEADITLGTNSIFTQCSLLNDIEIYEYLEKNNDLVEFISSVSNALMQNAGISSVVLEHYSDIEEGWEKLFIFGEPVAGLSLDEAEGIEDAVMLELIDPSIEVLRGRLVVSIG